LHFAALFLVVVYKVLLHIVDATTNCHNFSRLFGARRKTPRRRSSSRMCVINHNWSATKQRLHPKAMIQAFVISRPNSCNALCYGITNELTRCLQSVQNAAARLVTGTICRLCSTSCTGFLSGRCTVELYHASHLWYPPFYTSPMASSALQH